MRKNGDRRRDSAEDGNRGYDVREGKGAANEDENRGMTSKIGKGQQITRTVGKGAKAGLCDGKGGSVWAVV